ncbi:DAP3-binding cell death enhancer 1-like isoform X2 [Pantherophis guttatus]|uniref:DAP3-binding cell death enhancer 1-like isoform X2 n=1 Tax=Pantherophis guttatus TaxID=94885 RepID=A0A6P9B842_PANGU|nr:DAP3-binding cell death enhancer 1 isoform X2 [Pantherophis guttatus]XP_060542713.1 DAP3-binding cell death enhancer 1-like isoform X2 [Pantherophis guttatus]
MLSCCKAKPIQRRKMLWRWLWSFSRGVRSPGAVAGLFRSRLQERESLLLVQESIQTDNSWHGKHQQHKTFGDRNVYCYTPLEAFTWSTLAVLALELTKQAHWLHAVQPDGRNTKVCQSEPRSADLSQRHQSGNFVFPSSTSFESDSSLLDLKTNLEEEELVKEAASQVQETFQASISVASNILGLENMQAEQYKMAFSCFKMAADHNYSKAQYNLGLCYERGRGTTKDMTKAILYYQRAAHQGHFLAQYRYVKWLFCCWYKAAMQNQNELPLKERTCLSSPCLQSLGQPLSAHLGQPAVGLLRSWSIGHLEDMADSCELQSYLGLSDEVSIKLQPLPCCSEIVVD